jgi:hypothetical protein
MNTLDYKKASKKLYLPPETPGEILVPEMTFLQVDGRGDPNEPDGEYAKAVGLLYALTYTIKMSKKSGRELEGYVDFVVPPLEGLWWIDSGEFSFDARANWRWTLMIRQPEFVDNIVFDWAVTQLLVKKPGLHLDEARFQCFTEGLCAQIMHIGPYSTEPETMKLMNEFMVKESLTDRLTHGGKHHEIYLSDPRKGTAENMKTVLRHPVMAE